MTPRPRAAGPGARTAPARSAQDRPAGLVDLTPGIRSLQVQGRPGAAAAADADGLLAEAEDQLPGRIRARGPEPHGALPLSLGRPGHPGGDPAVHARRPLRRALVPGEHRVHPADQRSRAASTTCSGSCRRRVPGARAGRRVPRRAGRTPDRSAASAGDDEVQPGAHLDAGERGRDRRRLPVHLRDGGPRRLPVRRSHHASLESPASAAGSSFEPEHPWLLRFFDRISWYPVSADELMDLRADMAAGRGTVQIVDGEFSLAEHERSSPRTPPISPRSGHNGGGPGRGTGALGRRREFAARKMTA